MSVSALSGHTQQQWQETADRELESPATAIFIDGEYLDAIDGGRFDNINPVTRAASVLTAC
ncbi:MAG: hypothetical protein KJO31_01700 [Gammaproteobacteria bacterium]|nr:hypothetical protein [Gammaproteobacteria bacterium]